MDDATEQLAQLLRDYGADWQIAPADSGGAWAAVRRPAVSSLRIVVGLTVAELRARLAEAGDDD